MVKLELSAYYNTLLGIKQLDSIFVNSEDI
jgi:hypothetical protein